MSIFFYILAIVFLAGSYLFQCLSIKSIYENIKYRKMIWDDTAENYSSTNIYLKRSGYLLLAFIMIASIYETEISCINRIKQVAVIFEVYTIINIISLTICFILFLKYKAGDKKNHARKELILSTIVNNLKTIVVCGFISFLINPNYFININYGDDSDRIKALTGHYSNSQLSVDIDAKKSTIRVEYFDSSMLRSVVNEKCEVSRITKFTSEDFSGKNSYWIKVKENSIKLLIRQPKIINEREWNGWHMPPMKVNLPIIKVELPKISDTPQKYSISSWTYEMIVEAINNYLSKYNKYELRLNDVYGDEGFLRDKKTGMIDSNISVSWGDEDFAKINLKNSDLIGESFHLKEYLDENEYEVVNKWNVAAPIDIDNYYGEYSSNNICLKLGKRNNNSDEKRQAVVAYLSLPSKNGDSVISRKYIGHAYNNIVYLYCISSGETGQCFIVIEDDKVFLSCYNSNVFKEVVRQEMQYDKEFIDYELVYKPIMDECMPDHLNGYNNNSHGSTYSLYDIDENGVPELFLSTGGGRLDGCIIYTINDGEFVFLGRYGIYGGLEYDIENRMIILEGPMEESMGDGFYFNGYELQDGELKNVLSQYNIEEKIYFEMRKEIVSDNVIILGTDFEYTPYQ